MLPRIHEVTVGTSSHGVVFDYLSVDGKYIQGMRDMARAMNDDGTTSLACIIVVDRFVVFNENVFLSGVYHAIKDRLVHQVELTSRLELDILLHNCCTRQIQALQDLADNATSSRPDNTDRELVLVHVFPIDDVAVAMEKRSKLMTMFDLQSSMNLEYNILEDNSFQTMLIKCFKLDVRQARERGMDGIARLVRTRMALFSLALQARDG